MEKDVLRRFAALVDTHGFFNDLQMCPCEFETLGGFDAKALATELIERADNGNYSEENCNYRPLKWIEKAIILSERLIGTREGDVPREEIEKIVHAIYPEYSNPEITFKDAEGLLRGKITKMVESSLDAKRHFLVFPENPKRWMEVRQFLDRSKIEDKQLSRALWAYSDGFNKIDAAHKENRMASKALSDTYAEIFEEKGAPIKDALAQYADTLRKLQMTALLDVMVRKLYETGGSETPQLSDSAMDLVAGMRSDAREHEIDAILAIPDKNYCKEYKQRLGALVALENGMLESPPSDETRQKYFGLLKEVEKIANCEHLDAKAKEMREYAMKMLGEYGCELRKIEAYFSKAQLAPALEKEGIKDYIIGF